ncbi:MAG: SDR family oxidoreductase [Ilumatobacteraceae bacterium]
MDAGNPDALPRLGGDSAEQLGGIDIYVHNTSGEAGQDAGGVGEQLHRPDGAGARCGGEPPRSSPPAVPACRGLLGTTAAAGTARSASSYSAFKAAATNWTLGQAQVLGAQGIRCNVVSPGPIMVPGGDWDRIKGAMPEFFEATAKVHPGGHIGEVADVADLVTFLVSPRAKHISGANVTVDGGFLKRVNY